MVVIRGNPQPVVVAAFRRGGSSIVFELLSMLVTGAGRPVCDLGGDESRRGIYIGNSTTRTLRRALAQDQLVGAFRDIPPAIYQVLPPRAKTVVVVRDPRDCVLSWYYARRLHGDIRDASLEDYLKYFDDLRPIADRILDFAAATDALVLKYESLVTRPIEFILELLTFMDLDVPRHVIDLVIVKAASLQLVADGSAHNREGAPHSALRTLKARDSALLTQRYLKALKRLEYPLTLEEVPPLPAMVDRRELDAVKRYSLGLAHENAIRAAEHRQLVDELNALRESLGRENAIRIDEIADLRNQLSSHLERSRTNLEHQGVPGPREEDEVKT